MTDLTRQVDTLRRDNDAIKRERAAWVRENQALRAEVQRLKFQGRRPTHRRGHTDDPYAVLHVHHNAPPEVIEAAYRALAKLHHPDVGGSKTTMPRLNWARDRMMQRNGHPR